MLLVSVVAEEQIILLTTLYKFASFFLFPGCLTLSTPPPPWNGDYYMIVTGVGEVWLFQLLLFV